MIIQGQYTSAEVFADTIEDSARQHLQDLCDHPAMAGIRITQMPDVHAGQGCNIGTAYPIGRYLNPEHVGVDIGCSISMYRLSGQVASRDFALLDHRLRAAIPTGANIQPPKAKVLDTRDLYRHLNRAYQRARSAVPDLLLPLGQIDEAFVTSWLKRLRVQAGLFYRALGTLGGGNHFMEYGEALDSGQAWFTIHTGSRGLGVKVCQYWAHIAKDKRRCQYEGYLEGETLVGYLTDMVLTQAYAEYNHRCIAQRVEEILGKLSKVKMIDQIHSPHNYIDFAHTEPMLHKGSVDASEGSRVCIPFNMRDGIAIGIGKGNPSWNYSAPHGAGRLLSRHAAKRNLSLQDFVAEMQGVFSTSVCNTTLDEAPGAYKPIEQILEQIRPSVEVITIVKPRLNIKDIPK